MNVDHEEVFDFTPEGGLVSESFVQPSIDDIDEIEKKKKDTNQGNAKDAQLPVVKEAVPEFFVIEPEEVFTETQERPMPLKKFLKNLPKHDENEADLAE